MQHLNYLHHTKNTLRIPSTRSYYYILRSKLRCFLGGVLMTVTNALGYVSVPPFEFIWKFIIV
jgi:hypothetical protein